MGDYFSATVVVTHHARDAEAGDLLLTTYYLLLTTYYLLLTTYYLLVTHHARDAEAGEAGHELEHPQVKEGQ